MAYAMSAIRHFIYDNMHVQDTLEWLLGYLPTQAADDVRQLLDSQGGGGDAIEVDYKEYDWGLNST